MESQLVNYYIFDEIWSLLERIQIIDNIDFSEWDPHTDSDVTVVVSEHIEPFLSALPGSAQDLVRWTFYYYSYVGSAPWLELRNPHQELQLPDFSDPGDFMRRVGCSLYQNYYFLPSTSSIQFLENPNHEEARRLLLYN